ncbi:MAG: IS30 family transposase [Bacteroidia bacterium]|nr:MAG: IS30 family transposase [Bacteroidia bacterium]
MQRKYKQLTFEKRVAIQTFLQENYPITQIAEKVGCSRQTIYNELKRNGSPKYGKYTATQAQERRNKRRVNSNKKPMIDQNKKLQAILKEKFSQKWSPEMIVHRLRREKKLGNKELEKLSIPCKETIYQFIYRRGKEGDKEWISYLKSGHKKRQKRRLHKKRRGIIKDRVFIDQRPKEINDRTRIGDWEIDTIEGKNHKGFVISMTERASRFTLFRLTPCKNAGIVFQTIRTALFPFYKKGLVHSITFDNGKEFAFHYRLKEQWNIHIFFTQPYSAWQKGTIERINREFRTFFPKKTSFASLKPNAIISIQNTINLMPRKVLHYLNPIEFLSLYLQTNMNPTFFLNPKMSNFQVDSTFLISGE